MLWNRKVDVKNKAVLITGCDTGFGHRLALKLNQKGFRVYATVLDANSLGSQELRVKCVNKNKMIVIQMDVTSEEMVTECYDQVKDDLDNSSHCLWALVNNAGIFAYGHTEWGQMDQYYKLFDVNVFGVVRVTRQFAPLIRLSQGRIVIVASLAGRLTFDNLGIYCMSKHAVISYSDALRREMRKFKVKVSTIEPGIFKTDMFFSVESILQNTWNITDPSLKQVYGEQYFAKHMDKVKNIKKLGQATKDLDLVINDMVDAIIIKNPSRSYKPIKFTLKPLLLFMPLYPQFVIDMVFNFIDTTVPDVRVTKSSLSV